MINIIYCYVTNNSIMVATTLCVPGHQRSSLVFRSVKRLTCGRSVVSLLSSSLAGHCIQALQSTTRSATSPRHRACHRSTCSTRPQRRHASSTDKTRRATILSGGSKLVCILIFCRSLQWNHNCDFSQHYLQ